MYVYVELLSKCLQTLQILYQALGSVLGYEQVLNGFVILPGSSRQTVASYRIRPDGQITVLHKNDVLDLIS